SSGNTNTCAFTVTVLDKQAPILSGCPGDITKYSTPGVPILVTWTDPTANDNCQGLIPVTCTPTNGSFFSIGTTRVKCLASDSGGNTSTCSFAVTILETQAPRITELKVLGTDVIVQFTTQSGGQYALEGNENIASVIWNTLLSGISGNGNLI